MVFTIFTATCGDDFIADEELRLFSIKEYLDGYSRDVDCWWNIESQSADEIIFVRAYEPKNLVQVTLEWPVCFYFSVDVFSFSFFSALLVMLKRDKKTKSNLTFR